MKLQTLDPLTLYVRSTLKREPQIRLSTLFKHVRKLEGLSMYGDWPLMTELVFEAARLGIFYTNKGIVKALKCCNDPFLKVQRVDSEYTRFLANKDELIATVANEK